MANESLSKLRRLQADAQALLEVKDDDAPEAERFAQSPAWLQFCVRVHRSFVRNRGLVRAAALAYTTVLALVPLLAIAVSVSTGLLKREGEEPIQQLIDGFVRYVAPALDLKTTSDAAPDGVDSESAINRKRVVNEINGFIQRFKSTTLGASGVLALIFVAISLLSTVEATFNDMWGVREGRSWPRRVALYWMGLTLGPLLFVAAVGLTGASQVRKSAWAFEATDIKDTAQFVNELKRTNSLVSQFLNSQFSEAAKKALADYQGTPKDPGLVSDILAQELNRIIQGKPIYDAKRFEAVMLSPQTRELLKAEPLGNSLVHLNRLLLEDALPEWLTKSAQNAGSWLDRIEILRKFLYLFLLPCLVLGLSLSLLYLLMPNAKVDWRAALVGGLAGALLLQGNSAFSVMYLSRVVTYRDIYGTLAAVPLFLIGLYVSWVIVLLGGQVAYVFQTRKTQDADPRMEKINQRSREFVALRVMTHLGQFFQRGAPAPDVASLARSLEIQDRLAAQTLETLTQNKLLVRVSGAPASFSPARPLENITVQDVLNAMRVGAGNELAGSDARSSRLIQEQLDAIARTEAQAAGAVTLRELVERTADRPTHGG